MVEDLTTHFTTLEDLENRIERLFKSMDTDRGGCLSKEELAEGDCAGFPVEDEGVQIYRAYNTNLHRMFTCRFESFQ